MGILIGPPLPSCRLDRVTTEALRDLINKQQGDWATQRLLNSELAILFGTGEWPSTLGSDLRDILAWGCSFPSADLSLLHLAVSNWVSEQLRSFLNKANGSWLLEPECGFHGS